jgi:hypothetical protein
LWLPPRYPEGGEDAEAWTDIRVQRTLDRWFAQQEVRKAVQVKGGRRTSPGGHVQEKWGAMGKSWRRLSAFEKGMEEGIKPNTTPPMPSIVMMCGWFT